MVAAGIKESSPVIAMSRLDSQWHGSAARPTGYALPGRTPSRTPGPGPGGETGKLKPAFNNDTTQKSVRDRGATDRKVRACQPAGVLFIAVRSHEVCVSRSKQGPKCNVAHAHGGATHPRTTPRWFSLTTRARLLASAWSLPFKRRYSCRAACIMACAGPCGNFQRNFHDRNALKQSHCPLSPSFPPEVVSRWLQESQPAQRAH